MKPRIGYLGLGLMGGAMTRHLVSKGYEVTGFDPVAEKRVAAHKNGVRVVMHARDVVPEADFILLNLPTTEAVLDAVFGTEGIAASLSARQILIDFSTIKVDAARAAAERLLAEAGCGWIDAPVSGGPPAAGSGTLTVMAGGREGDLERVRTLMADIAARFTPMGPSGAGLVAKMINQLIVGCTHAVLAEAAVLADSAGIDAALIPECLAGGHADGSLLQRLYPRMVAGEFAPQGYLRQLLKDLEMVHAFAGSSQCSAPMTAEALSLYRLAARLGFSELDTSAVVKIYER
jgi:3-hydroxyisobutyrate dehydrogenase-like beta-hydroxyacid dehydrogenase